MDANRDIFSENFLLSAVGASGSALIGQNLHAVDLPAGFSLASSGQEVEFGYFLRSGVASVVARSSTNRSCEVVMIGREGIAPAFAFWAGGQSPLDVVMQVAGEGYRIDIEALRVAVDASARLRHVMNMFVQTIMVQSAYTALVNANYPAQERLARWILMYDDRIDGDRILLTHGLFSTILGVRRQTITEALHALEQRQLIRSERSMVFVRDRAGLEALAHDCYGCAEAEYVRLIGEFRKRSGRLDDARA